MVFGKNDIVIGPVKEEEEQQQVKPFGLNDTVLSKEPVPPTPTSKQTLAALDTSRADVGPSLAELEFGVTPEQTPRKEKEDQIYFDELTQDQYFNPIEAYAKVRFGKSGEQGKNESREDYIKRWASAMRANSLNTALNAVPELNWISNAKKEDVLKAAKAYEIFDKLPSVFEEGGQKGVRPFAEGVASIASDPTNIATFGIGAFTKYALARETIKKAVSARIKAAAAGASVEGVVGTAGSLVEQQTKLEAKKAVNKEAVLQAEKEGSLTKEEAEKEIQKIDEESVSLVAAAQVGLFSAVFGAAEAGSLAGKPKKTTKQELKEILDKRPPTPVNKKENELVTAFDSDMEQTLDEFDIFEGRKKLDELSPPTPLTQAEVRRDINIRAINFAKNILKNDPSFAETAKRVVTKQQKVSSAVRDVFSSLDTIDEVVLEAALKKEKLTLQDFADITLTTASDAGAALKPYSDIVKLLKKQAEIDPDIKKQIDAIYGRDSEVVENYSYLTKGLQRLDREVKAILVSGLGTTVRNVMGTSAGLTLDAGAKLVEGVLFQSGKVLKSAAKGTYEAGDLSRGLNTVVRDAFGTLTYLTNAGLTAEVADALLTYNPALKKQMLSALQESGNETLSKPARFLNTLNVAQDALFRRAIFTATVEKQLRGVGLDMYQLLKENKVIPADVLKNAADAALKGTFSYMPKKGIAYNFVNLFEKAGPAGSLLITFPRFMVNAMSFMTKYSPVGAASGTVDMARAVLTKDKAMSERLYRKGSEAFGQGFVGMAAITAAYLDRLENQDTEFYNKKLADGSTVDLRALFPIGPIYALGDYLAKWDLGKLEGVSFKEHLEALVGIKMPAGSQGYLLDRISSAIGNAEGKEAERFEKGFGTVLGDYFGRVLAPGKPLFDFIDLVKKESQIARDPNVVEGDDLLTDAALQRIQAKIPLWKEELPEAKPMLREGPVVRAGEFFTSLTGVRVVPRVNEIEEQFKMLSIDPYKYYMSSGDKVYDRAVKDNSIDYIDKLVGKLITSKRYQEMDDLQKKKALDANMKLAMGAGRHITQASMMKKDRDRVNKMEFYSLPANERALINSEYAKRNNGVTLDEAKDYAKVYEYRGKIEQFR